MSCKIRLSLRKTNWNGSWRNATQGISFYFRVTYVTIYSIPFEPQHFCLINKTFNPSSFVFNQFESRIVLYGSTNLLCSTNTPRRIRTLIRPKYVTRTETKHVWDEWVCAMFYSSSHRFNSSHNTFFTKYIQFKS